MLDTLIKNATVFDGMAVEPRQVCVGIRGDRIALVGAEPGAGAASEVVDANGLFLCPGFIDTHASTGLGYMLPNAGDNKITQGITSEIIGNCGTSTAPIGELLVPEMERLASEIGFELSWRDVGEWFRQLEAHGLPFNIGTYVGHSTLRAGTCSDSQQVTVAEIQSMCALLDRALEDGALGLSTGLVYAPGSFATTGEIIELAKVVARHDGIYVSHIRNERESLEEAVDEAIEVGSAAGVPVLISHLKAAEVDNWGKIPAILERIEKARAAGVAVNFEVYPYTATSTKLRTFLPKEAMSGGVVELVAWLRTPEWRQRSIDHLESRRTQYDAMVMITGGSPDIQGRSILEIARLRAVEPAAAAIDLVIENPDAWIVYHCIDESDMDAAIEWPHSIICSDSWSYPVNAPNPIGHPHPRTYGAFTRFLERYALRRARLPFGRAIRKVSSFAADWLGLEHRGRIAEGCFADLVLLDPERVRERATYQDPRQLSDGTQSVWVNGEAVIDNGELVDRLPGRVLERSGERG